MFGAWAASLIGAFVLFSLSVYVRNETAIAVISRKQTVMFNLQQFIAKDVDKFLQNPDSFCDRAGILDVLDDHALSIGILSEGNTEYTWARKGKGPSLSLESLSRHTDFSNKLYMRSTSGGATLSIPWMYMDYMGKLQKTIARVFSVGPKQHVIVCAYV